jgi:SAM-dependent methyltransferase
MPLRLLWFGHGTNLASIVELLPELHALVTRCDVALHLVTAPNAGIEQVCVRFNEHHAPAFQLRLSPWSADMTWRALRDCDLVIIPIQKDDPRKAVKSPNRLIEGLWAGRFVIANPIPSYEEFGAFAWLGDSIVSGIGWALDHPRDVMRRIAAGQSYIEKNYSPGAIARDWDAAIQAALNIAPGPSASGPPLKLNLGCGDKILPGYVNVDIAQSRKHAKPDVVCDLRRLIPFADNTADEVLSVHVVEHFWRWEAVAVLREWVRVLKPGGKMVLECPNLLSACQELIRNPDLASGPGAEGRRTMWVFYGDPAWKDPLMVHRWGYTPRSLADVMSEAGLVNIRQEPAQFKLREPRDMRVVGERPHGE